MTRVVVDVMLKPEILDPQGQAVERALPSLGLQGVRSVRIGKHIELELGDDVTDARSLVTEVADKLLANPVIEAYTVTVVSEGGAPDGVAVDGLAVDGLAVDGVAVDG